MLDLSEEDAIKQFEALLNDTSYFTVVFDRIHDWWDLLAIPARVLMLVAGHNIYETSSHPFSIPCTGLIPCT